MKTLTIIVPIYNKESLLKQCLESMNVPQIRDDLEVIMIDDGSKDQSLEIMKQYQQMAPETYKVYTQTNQGVGAVMSKGISVATGRYIKEVDADDWVDSNALITLIEYLKTTQVDIIVNPFQFVNDITLEVNERFFKNVWFNYVYDIEDVLPHVSFSVQACTIRRAILAERKFELSKQRYYIDMQLIESSIMFAKTCVILRDSLYRYRVGQSDQSVNINSYIKNRNSFYEETVLSFKRLKELIQFNYSIEKIEMQKRYCRMYAIYLFGITALSDKGSVYEVESMIRNHSVEIYDSLQTINMIQRYRSDEFKDESDFKLWVRESFESLLKIGDGIDGLEAFYYIGDESKAKKSRDYNVHIEQKNILNQWMMNLEQGILTEQYFLKRGYCSVAIYGMGILGRHLYCHLKNSKIKVKYGIDQKADKLSGISSKELCVLKPQDYMDNIDVIVVTALKQYKQIKDMLSKKMTCDIVSIEDVVYRA